jgi:hypothetical protein
MRERRTSLFPVAVSPAKLADSIGMKRAVVADAIKNDLLPCYQKGLKRRVLICDAVEWIRNRWERVS